MVAPAVASDSCFVPNTLPLRVEIFRAALLAIEDDDAIELLCDLVVERRWMPPGVRALLGLAGTSETRTREGLDLFRWYVEDRRRVVALGNGRDVVSVRWSIDRSSWRGQTVGSTPSLYRAASGGDALIKDENGEIRAWTWRPWARAIAAVALVEAWREDGVEEWAPQAAVGRLAAQAREEQAMRTRNMNEALAALSPAARAQILPELDARGVSFGAVGAAEAAQRERERDRALAPLVPDVGSSREVFNPVTGGVLVVDGVVVRPGSTNIIYREGDGDLMVAPPAPWAPRPPRAARRIKPAP